MSFVNRQPPNRPFLQAPRRKFNWLHFGQEKDYVEGTEESGGVGVDDHPYSSDSDSDTGGVKIDYDNIPDFSGLEYSESDGEGDLEDDSEDDTIDSIDYINSVAVQQAIKNGLVPPHRRKPNTVPRAPPSTPAFPVPPRAPRLSFSSTVRPISKSIIDKPAEDEREDHTYPKTPGNTPAVVPSRGYNSAPTARSMTAGSENRSTANGESPAQAPGRSAGKRMAEAWRVDKRKKRAEEESAKCKRAEGKE